jgi:two-component system response regulator YesN
VEDEEPVLDSYEFMLRETSGLSSGGFVLAGKARTGFEALEMIPRLKPDLVFMDINIPGIDGLSVIEEIGAKFPATVFVLSTAYERFDLAQRAIPLGVFAYLVKPVTRKAFFSTLEKVRVHLDAKRAKEGAASSPASLREGREFPPLAELLRGKDAFADWERVKREGGFPSDRGLIALVKRALNTEIPRAGWGARFVDALSLKYFCLCEERGDLVCLFISGSVTKNECGAQFDALVSVKDTPRPIWGIGENHEGREAARSLAEAREELRAREDAAGFLERERLLIAEIRRKIGVSSDEEVCALYRSYREDLFIHYDFATAKAKMIPLFVLLLDDLTGCYGGGAPSPHAPGEEAAMAPAEEITLLRDEPAFDAWTSAAFARLREEARIRREAGRPIPLTRAMEYIHAHYGEELSLGDAADAAGVSAAYLSRLFSEQLKTTFGDYLTDIRMSAAEKLLRESAVSVKEIAFAVGFQDPAYFSKTFRKQKGVLPSEIREYQQKRAPEEG